MLSLQQLINTEVKESAQEEKSSTCEFNFKLIIFAVFDKFYFTSISNFLLYNCTGGLQSYFYITAFKFS